MSRRVPRGGPGPEWPNEPDDGQAYGQQDYGPRGYANRPTQTFGYQGRGAAYQGRGPGGPAFPGEPSPDVPGRKVRLRRTRRFFRRRPVRIASAVVGVFLVFVLFSAGQAAFRNNGQGLSANLAEWARDHYLGPVVTFGEWLSYNPPPKGGSPSFSLAVPSGERTQLRQAGQGQERVHPGHPGHAEVPGRVADRRGRPVAGGGEGRREPAMLTTFLRDATYTSQVNGIASIDQRLVKFSLRPGTEDPGTSQNWGVPSYIPAGKRTGLLATFNGGFKLDSAGGGFYLNGIYHGSLAKGTASVVYYKNGTVKIGEWGRDFTMNPAVAGVRQNLRLLVDRGQVAANASSNVMSNWGATLGGGQELRPTPARERGIRPDGSSPGARPSTRRCSFRLAAPRAPGSPGWIPACCPRACTPGRCPRAAARTSTRHRSRPRPPARWSRPSTAGSRWPTRAAATTPRGRDGRATGARGRLAGDLRQRSRPRSAPGAPTSR